jgi:ribosomal protein S18 acetylase RimI-like enzyme
VDLRIIRAADLDAVLEEETGAWREILDWDFRPSADLVRRFVDRQALTGSALLVDGKAAGYAYYVAEERKGLIGNLYTLEACRTVERENHLLRSVLEAMMGLRRVRRVEAQLMMLANPFQRTLPGKQYLSVHERNFMLVDLAHAGRLATGGAAERIFLENWTEQWQDRAAQVIVAAYVGHIDSQINDQYRSAGGARRFLMNIVQYPGCGKFFQPASYLAFERGSGHLCGLSLASLVADDVGHITQICVTPAVKGTGAGYELMRRSLAALAAGGCRKASLTVTAANRNAVELYERMGFVTRRKFAAYVWEGF